MTCKGCPEARVAAITFYPFQPIHCQHQLQTFLFLSLRKLMWAVAWLDNPLNITKVNIYPLSSQGWTQLIPPKSRDTTRMVTGTEKDEDKKNIGWESPRQKIVKKHGLFLIGRYYRICKFQVRCKLIHHCYYYHLVDHREVLSSGEHAFGHADYPEWPD